MLEVEIGADGFRRKMCGLYDATSTVFSCPTRLISEVQVFRVMTAAMKTYPLLFVAFDAVMWAPSGDQL